MIRTRALGIALLALGLAACNPSSTTTTVTTITTTLQPNQIYSAEAFYHTTSYGLSPSAGLSFSPDGTSILVSSDATGVFNAYALPVSGGQPQALTASTTSATTGVTYFPNDARVLVQADQGGNELDHISVRALDGQMRDLTPGARLKADFLGWKSDGTTFYLTTNERNASAFDVYAYDATSYARRLVFRNTNYNVAAVSHDGRWLALVRQLSSANSDLYLVDLSATGAAAQPKLISQHTGNVALGVYEFTPENSALIYSTNENGEFDQAWSYDLATGAKSSLVAANWDVSLVTFSPSGRYRVSAVNADAQTQITIQDQRGNATVAITGAPPGDITAVRFNRDETKIAFLLSSDTSPPDVFVADLSNGQAHRLTTALNPAIDEHTLVTASVVRYPSFDGLQIPAILYRPYGSNAQHKVPAIVWVHGGPGGQSRRGYSASIQHLVNHGYAVLAVNNRGSSGYGKTFYHLDDRHHGDVDLKDVVQARTYLASQDWVDGNKIAIMGGSYGGYMVAAALAFQPNAFNAGLDLFGVTNWPRTLASIPPWWGAERQALYDELGNPTTDAVRLRAISPLFHTEGISKPLLVIQGHNDPRVLQRESDELVAHVRARHVPVDYVVFPDEGHGFARRENRITAQEHYVAFLDTYLKGQAPAASATTTTATTTTTRP